MRLCPTRLFLLLLIPNQTDLVREGTGQSRMATTKTPEPARDIGILAEQERGWALGRCYPIGLDVSWMGFRERQLRLRIRDSTVSEPGTRRLMPR